MDVVKIVVPLIPLKHLSNFWWSLEIQLINCKVELSLKWIESCVLTTSVNANNVTFKIPDAKLYVPIVPIVTLSAEDNAKLSKLLGKVFKKSIYWNKYKAIDNIPVQTVCSKWEKYVRERLDASYQGIERLFLLV